MKQTTCFLIIALVLMGNLLLAQTAQNTDPSAALEVDSTTKGFLLPRMSTAQRDAISAPVMGLTIYNLNTQTIDIYTGSAWKQLGANEGVVLSPTGRTWMDRNLGASQVATSSTDSDAYGFLFQWGRNADGHQERTSSTAAGPVAAGSEGSNFITTTGTDWLITADDTRWNGATKGVHDPCPDGFRVPTETELESERLLFPSNNVAGAFASVLKLPVAGYRNAITAALGNAGGKGHYWTSTVAGAAARTLDIDSNAAWASNYQAHGFSVRCLKE